SPRAVIRRLGDYTGLTGGIVPTVPRNPTGVPRPWDGSDAVAIGIKCDSSQNPTGTLPVLGYRTIGIAFFASTPIQTSTPSSPPPSPAPPVPRMPRRMSAPELATTALPERQMILDPILAQKSLMMLYGPRGLGKTHVALGIAWAAASGQSFLKWK